MPNPLEISDMQQAGLQIELGIPVTLGWRHGLLGRKQHHHILAVVSLSDSPLPIFDGIKKRQVQSGATAGCDL